MDFVKLHWGIKIGILVLGVGLSYYWAFKLILVMAEKHILIMKRKNGTAVPRYSKGGGLIDILFLYYGHNYDKETGEVKRLDVKEIKKGNKFISFIKSFFWIEGLTWLGLTRETREIKMRRWPRYRQQDDGKFKIEFKEEDQDFIWLKDDIYPVLIPGVELKGMGTVDCLVLFSIRVKNIDKTLRVENWLGMTLDRSSINSKDQLQFLSYEEITGKSEGEEKQYEKGKKGKSEDALNKTLTQPQREKISKYLFDELTKNGTIPTLFKDYGIEIFAISLGQVELSGPLAKEYQEASILGYKTNKEVERIGQLATARKNQISIVYSEIESHRNGLEIFKNETIQEAGRNGNTVILPMDFKGNVLIDTSKTKKGKEDAK
mgnify:CR=1 FL=1